MDATTKTAAPSLPARTGEGPRRKETYRGFRRNFWRGYMGRRARAVFFAEFGTLPPWPTPHKNRRPIMPKGWRRPGKFYPYSSTRQDTRIGSRAWPHEHEWRA